MNHINEEGSVEVQASTIETSRIEAVAPIATRPTSRRSFLGRGIAAAAVPAALAATPGQASAGNGPFPSYYTGSTKAKFQEIQSDEFQHVNILTNFIISLGGTPRPLPTFKNLTNLSASTFLASSKAFENTGVSAYLGAIPYVFNPAVVVAAAEIALVEAYHAGFINTLANSSLIPNGAALTSPLTQPQIINAISPYVVNLNDNGAFPPSFGTTPSAANDIEILNFALLLEDLEASFYYYNVPALFA